MSIKTFRQLLVTLTAVSVVITGCQKDDNGGSTTTSIVGKWKMSAYIHNGADVFGTGVGPCVIDDITTFLSNNQLINDEGPTKCNPSDPQQITGTYSLNSEKTVLTLIVDRDSNVCNLQVLNATTLKIEQQSNGDIITFARRP